MDADDELDVLGPEWPIFTVEAKFGSIKGLSLIVAFVTSFGSALLPVPLGTLQVPDFGGNLCRDLFINVLSVLPVSFSLAASPTFGNDSLTS